MAKKKNEELKEEVVENVATEEEKSQNSARQVFRKKLREGQLDDKEIEIPVSEQGPTVNVIGGAAPGMDEISDQLSSLFESMNQNKKTLKKMKEQTIL